MPTFGKFLAINSLRITLMVQNSYFMLVKMCCYQKWCVFCDSLLVKMCLKIQFYVQTTLDMGAFIVLLWFTGQCHMM